MPGWRIFWLVWTHVLLVAALAQEYEEPSGGAPGWPFWMVVAVVAFAVWLTREFMRINAPDPPAPRPAPPEREMDEYERHMAQAGKVDEKR